MLTYDIMQSISEKMTRDFSVQRMRKIRPAYRKVKKTIASCETAAQLYTAYNMIGAFHKAFPYADKFTVELYKTAYDHKYGDDLITMHQYR